MLMFGNYGVSKHTPPETNVYAMIIFATDTIIFTGFHVYTLLYSYVIYQRYKKLYSLLQNVHCFTT